MKKAIKKEVKGKFMCSCSACGARFKSVPTLQDKDPSEQEAAMGNCPFCLGELIFPEPAIIVRK
jgi:hypothetical protein